MDVSPERLNASLERFNVSLVGLCITMPMEVCFLKLIRLFLERPSVSSGRIISNKSRLRGPTRVNPRRLDFSLAKELDGGLN